MMGALKKITAWVLIGIFQVFLMHQALPHEHHTHDKSIDTATAVEHHHHNHHQHHGKSQHSHDTPDKDHSKSSNHHGLLGMLFGEHSHTNGINHQHILTPTTLQNQKVKELGTFSLTNQNLNRPGNQLRPLLAGYSPPIQSHYFYNPSLSHRGPPSTV